MVEDLKRLVAEAIEEMRLVREEMDQVGLELEKKAGHQDLEKSDRKAWVRDLGLLIVAAIAIAGMVVALVAAFSASDSASSVTDAEKCLATTQQLQLDRSRALAGPTQHRTEADRKIREWDAVEQEVFKKILAGDTHRKRLRHRFSVANRHKIHWQSVWKHWDDVYQQRDKANPVPNQKLCEVLEKRLPARTVTTTAHPSPSVSVSVSVRPGATQTVAGPTRFLPGPTVTTTAPGPTVTTTAPPGKAVGRHRHHR